MFVLNFLVFAKKALTRKRFYGIMTMQYNLMDYFTVYAG